MTGSATLTARERNVLEHLRHAQELGSTLKDYASAFNLNVEQLYNGKAQLQRKGLWPETATPAEAIRTELLAVEVTTGTVVAEPASALQANSGEPLLCRLRSPQGWVLECDRWPDPTWLMAVMSRAGDAQ